MNKILTLFKMAALAAAVFLCVSVGLMALKARTTLTKLDIAIAGSASITANINKTLDEINRPCSQQASCGTIADINRTLAPLRSAIGQIEVAARHENAQLSTLDAQERTLYTDLHTTLVAGQTTLGRSADLLTTANTTVQGLQPVLVESEIAVAQLQTTLDSVNTLVKDPALTATLKAVQATSEQTAATMSNVNKTSSDVKDAVHAYLHPTWFKVTTDWVLKIAKVFNPF
jgi:chromosome segregation ATPase